MERHNRELVRTRNYIRKKRRKSDFERAVSGSFAIFYEQAQEAAGGLKAQIERNGEPENYLCHGDLNQHHILLAEENEMAVIEFNRMHRASRSKTCIILRAKYWKSMAGICVWGCGCWRRMIVFCR